MSGKRFLVCILAFIGFEGSSFAQDVTLKWGNISKQPNRGAEAAYVVGRDTGGFYVVSTKNKGRKKVFLERYGNDNNLKWSKQLAIPSNDAEEGILEKIIYLNGRLLLFTSDYNRKLDKNFAFVSTISPEGVVNNDLKQIDEIQSKAKMNAGDFDFMLSHDSTSVLVYHNEPYERNAQDKFSIKVMNADLEIIWQKDISLPYRDRDFSVSNYIVSGDKVYMLARLQEGNREKKGGRPNYKFIILSYEEAEPKPREYVVSLGDKFISDITFEIGHDKNLVCAGFYSKNNSADIGGTFYLVIDSDDESVLSKSIKDFDENILSKFMNERRAKKGRELYSYELRKLVPMPDGSSILVAEQFYIRKTTDDNSTTGTSTTRYYYYYNDIILVSIGRNGEIGWVTDVPKYQSSVNDFGYYSSFAIAVYKDKIGLLYNDHRKNLTKPKKTMRPMTSPKNAAAVLVLVDGKSGEYTKKALFEQKKKAPYLKPKLHLQTAADELVIYAKRGSKFVFGTLKFD
jgi:hypothetical protein